MVRVSGSGMGPQMGLDGSKWGLIRSGRDLVGQWWGQVLALKTVWSLSRGCERLWQKILHASLTNFYDDYLSIRSGVSKLFS